MQPTSLIRTERASRVEINVALARLRHVYGEPVPPPRLDPLDELIATILSQNTSDVNTARSFKNLRAHFPTWTSMIEATDSEIADAIRSGGLADKKGPRIRHILTDIHERCGAFDLSFLARVPLDDAKQWLTSLQGVGPKTAACVLLFSLGRPAIPVDTHVHRVALRLGWIPEGTSAERAHVLLERQIAQRDVLAAHLLLIQHGRRTCHARRPKCRKCILIDECPSAPRFLESQRTLA